MTKQELTIRYNELEAKMKNVKSHSRKMFYIKKQSELTRLYRELKIKDYENIQ